MRDWRLREVGAAGAAGVCCEEDTALVAPMSSAQQHMEVISTTNLLHGIGNVRQQHSL
jgi:hypothetical protein